VAVEASQPYNQININKIFLPFTSRGILHILINLLFLKWKTRKIEGLFHITGDVHYSILVLPANRTVLTIHDLVFLHTYKGLTRKILKWLYLDLPLRKALHITTISEKSKQEILDHSPSTPQKITVIADPIDPLFTKIQPSALVPDHLSPVPYLRQVHQSKLASSSLKLLFLGTKPNKNLEPTIAALFQLPIHLRIIGELTNRQKKLLNKYKIDYSNVFSISQEALLQEYSNADIVLFPSTYEGFGLPVIEAFATGKPVITSNISPMKEVAGSAAILIEPYSIDSIRKAVQKLIDDPVLRVQLSNAGLQRVLEYLPPQITFQYKSIWEKVSAK
jgi:glycosyltransferase involved in cell wall biosynthesis